MTGIDSVQQCISVARFCSGVKMVSGLVTFVKSNVAFISHIRPFSETIAHGSWRGNCGKLKRNRLMLVCIYIFILILLVV